MTGADLSLMITPPSKEVLQSPAKLKSSMLSSTPLRYEMPSVFEYLIREFSIDTTLVDIQSQCNQLGAQGWQLAFVSHTSDQTIIWFIRAGTATQAPQIPEEEPKA